MDKKIAHLGKKTGKMLLFGGVYSNLQALETLISIAEREKIDPSNCICTGDIVGYCAQPEETIQRFKKWGANSIAGNVEFQLAHDKEDCGCDFETGGRCDIFSKMWYPYAKNQLSTNSMEWIAELPDYLTFTYGEKTIMVVHGSYGNISKYIFKSTPLAKKESQFKDTASDIIIAGHCGLPFSNISQNGVWLNPGVIGMPANDGTPRVWYMILDDSNGCLEYTHHHFQYDYRTTQQLMLDNGLPKSYADTLSTGIWDNMEILPESEKKQKGLAIDFGEKEFLLS